MSGVGVGERGVTEEGGSDRCGVGLGWGSVTW